MPFAFNMLHLTKTHFYLMKELLGFCKQIILVYIVFLNNICSCFYCSPLFRATGRLELEQKMKDIHLFRKNLGTKNQYVLTCSESTCKSDLFSKALTFVFRNKH